MRKSIIILFFCTILIFSGYLTCSYLSPYHINSISVEKQENIIGKWEISYAEHKSTGANYPLQEIYGSGFQYGGTLEFKKDGTFNKWIGISDGEISTHEGTFSIQNNTVTLVYYSGNVDKAFYNSSSNILKVENDFVDAYEYFVPLE
ncbi:lipocalin family protein [Acetivibrio sp. MSJd-27]|uniref:lipocalin family protein n=1 Tax=Acetivibrio sp. MSJd-27 TaxID=2841523 RepID=UPI001C10667C|nr:lipocalin family protein [Acetivibrio sp. MSJd-27]MBU5451499.1 lipocalin family protein [Acetivibrio sp. MSJd-27]